VVDFLMLEAPVIDEVSWAKTMIGPATDILRDTLAAYESCEWDADALKETLQGIGDRHGLKLGKVQAPVRVAVSGRTVGPPLFEALEVLGRDETMRRLKWAMDRLAEGAE
jgi:glutamyl-tRNA synthetase